jgi:hypothetical protein
MLHGFAIEKVFEVAVLPVSVSSMTTASVPGGRPGWVKLHWIVPKAPTETPDGRLLKLPELPSRYANVGMRVAVPETLIGTPET